MCVCVLFFLFHFSPGISVRHVERGLRCWGRSEHVFTGPVGGVDALCCSDTEWLECDHGERNSESGERAGDGRV